MKKCSVDGCEKPVRAKGFCSTHWRRDRLGKDMHAPIKRINKSPKGMPAIERAMKYVVVTDNGCWEWTASKDAKGYGVFNKSRAHRFMYEFHKGPIPDGLQIDHLCRNPPCVNPDHLEAVTHVENMRRGVIWDFNKSKTHCPRGHEYTAENTYICKAGKRTCRTCQRINARRHYWKRGKRLRQERNHKRAPAGS